MAPKTAKTKNGKFKRKAYEKELRKLQIDLCHLQECVAIYKMNF